MCIDQFNNGHRSQKEKQDAGYLPHVFKQLMVNLILSNTAENINRPTNHTGKQCAGCFVEFDLVLKSDGQVTNDEDGN